MYLIQNSILSIIKFNIVVVGVIVSRSQIAYIRLRNDENNIAKELIMVNKCSFIPYCYSGMGTC